VWFADADGVIKTVASYMTLVANRLGPDFTSSFLFLPLGM
jgi:hypothetical protein